jgi:serine phosphatase RsbU (regulator of sigma subunit)
MLRRSGGGEVRLLEGALGPPLGVRTGAPYPEAAVVLDQGDTVLLYSDGLIERRGRRIDDGLELARRAFQTLPERGSLDDFCRSLIDAVYPEVPGGDDTCVLLVRRKA